VRITATRKGGEGRGRVAMDPTKFGRKLTPMAVVKWERTEGLYAYSSDESDGKT